MVGYQHDRKQEYRDSFPSPLMGKKFRVCHIQPVGTMCRRHKGRYEKDILFTLARTVVDAAAEAWHAHNH